MKYLFFALRPQQWIKNIFIFLPLVFGGKLFVFSVSLKILVAFILFSITASVVYLINDIIDIKKDKIHPVKRLRPIASGKVSIKQATLTALVLGVFSIVLSFMFNAYFGCIVIIYILFNIVYSKLLKKIVIIDVLCIGAFFLLRIIAGSVVADVEMSHWIVIMTTLLALFLGFIKRRQELKIIKRKAALHRYALTEYNFSFIDQMIAVITSSIVVSYMLYTVDSRTVAVFKTKNLIFSIPFVYYGIFRYLYLIYKKGKDGNPVRILLFDKMTQVNIALWIITCIIVIYSGF